MFITRSLPHIGLGLLAVCSCPVLAEPTIVEQPASCSFVQGSDVQFTVKAAGRGPLTYQWQFNFANIHTNGLITSVAGSSNPFSGEGGTATNFALMSPSLVVGDLDGSFLIAQSSRHHIYRVDTNGIIRRIAGSSTTSGFAGDGGYATNALLNTPKGIAIDAAGNLFIADSLNNRVRKVDVNGYITTVAGGGSGGDGGLAINAALSGPAAVAADAQGSIFIAETDRTSRIRKVDASGVISTVAGVGPLGFSGDGGPATAAKLFTPRDVVLDGKGNLFIADSRNQRVRKVDTNGIIWTVAGGGTGGDGGQATNAALANLDGICVDEFGCIFIAEPDKNIIRQVKPDGTISTIAGFGATSPLKDGGYATNAALYSPRDVSLDNAGNLLIADTSNNRIRKVTTGRDPSFRIQSVTQANAGEYRVIITDLDGSTISSNALLTIMSPPSIVPDWLEMPGSPGLLSVTASGTAPLHYQWYVSSNRTAYAEPDLSMDGRVLTVWLLEPGSGYVVPPNVRFVGGGGSGASASATIDSGRVVSIFMINQGAGYTSRPEVVIENPPFVGTPIVDATNATYRLPAATSAIPTNYCAMVTNEYGFAVSPIRQIMYVYPPESFVCEQTVEGVRLRFSGSGNYPYVLETATNLAPPSVWTDVESVYTDASGNWEFSDTNASAPLKLYRAHSFR